MPTLEDLIRQELREMATNPLRGTTISAKMLADKVNTRLREHGRETEVTQKISKAAREMDGVSMWSRQTFEIDPDVFAPRISADN